MIILKWLNKLERKYGRYAISGLMKYIVAANLAVFLLEVINPGLEANLMLIPQAVMAGQLWRLVTFILIPPATSAFWILFTLYFYYIIGMGLEQAWGSFKFNIYYLVGMIATIIVSLIGGSPATGIFINLTLFLAFASIYPNHEVLLFFILPVKVKYLGILNAVLLAQQFIMGGVGIKLMILASLANYFIFFGKDFIELFKTKKKVKRNKEKFKVIEMKDYVRHRCTVCGITERDDPNMEFRYCSKCSGHKEYCMNHLKNHEHIND
ncbi:rhomboid family intramembrane serine protease [Clostridium sulfidigenes]|uniref:rhomboid family intramembrane serine protease n=1 Tax=Clostridium sulfidigenes TaxID=318464 RepID=UPI003F8B43F6